MKKILSTLALCLCAVGSMQAQTLKQQGSSIGQIVPQGWTHQEVMGDLNKRRGSVMGMEPVADRKGYTTVQAVAPKSETRVMALPASRLLLSATLTTMVRARSFQK